MGRGVFLKSVILGMLLVCVSLVAEAQAPGYAGSGACSQCHGAKYASYQETWHAKMLRPATDEAVLGDFGSADPDLTFSLDEVVYVVGGQYSQRYLTELDDGELYVLPAQWNVVSAEWVAYHPDDWQERPYTRLCAGCHTTGFDAESGLWLEDGVWCEACHGPGLNHVAFTGDTSQIINPALLEFDDQTEICGQCHLRGHDLAREHDFPTDYRPGGPLTLDEAFIVTTDPEAFFPDGSSRLHHQEYLDWQQSGHADGVACVFCHVSHSEGETRHQTRFVGDHRCVICHEDKKDLARHIPFHPLGEIVCTDCHMPTLAKAATAEYNFDIHSHTFWPPNPAATIQFGGQGAMPNACNLCHADQSPEWAAEAMGLEIGVVSLGPTATPMMPPTPVPTVTPFLEVSLEAGEEVQEAGVPLLAYALVGLVLLGLLVGLILAVQGVGRRERKEA